MALHRHYKPCLRVDKLVIQKSIDNVSHCDTLLIMSKVITAKDLIWDKWNREHIEKHSVLPKQVEQVFRDNNRVYEKGYNTRIMVIGHCGKRMLSIIMAKENKKYYVITARDASKEERLFYYKNLEK